MQATHATRKLVAALEGVPSGRRYASNAFIARAEVWWSRGRDGSRRGDVREGCSFLLQAECRWTG